MAFELGQYVPGNSAIHRLDPRSKLLGLFLYGLALLVAPTGESAFLAGAVALPAVLAAGLSPSFIWKQLRPLAFFLALIFFLQLATTPGTILVYLGPVPVTREGFNLGLLALARVFFLILAAVLLTATTDPLALADGLERLLAPGQRIGLPSQELALMLTLALRFVPTLLEEAERIMRAQMARGASFRGLQVKNLLPLVIPLFVSAFRRAEGLAEAMEARAYQGGKGRTRMRELNFTATDFLFLLLAGALAAGTLFYRLKSGN
ncbi:cobalt transporter [Moorella thermoacetica]|uniref:energy-coupling factor transporter transmembrane component T family protein n=1 Tax=Neomoorella thermoacetica TaxID=1525 RepID=UPI0006A2A6BB|nr:energy-coupling factor transporter transmembrane protein EcfT [Moorella thermoacetica]AKX97912.1 energy-coupling factor transporter transmembrane protein EcfT [Moorella thermoacetica]OIQ56743.1 energy-coupling factor transporter transmembrane protein EcfT [Moorella thermoacetica]OIQ62449.1 energy-coupling factor transporter transmembrane protein EcfT [Moorella thermoacetica]QDA01731.1 Energy-coupling factor transporter transmembrane protein EcfT [Moorella thermoacetica]TYL09254.1 Energy-cou